MNPPYLHQPGTAPASAPAGTSPCSPALVPVKRAEAAEELPLLFWACLHGHWSVWGVAPMISVLSPPALFVCVCSLPLY